MLHEVQLYYFSPTGGTQRTGEIFCEGIAENIKAVNLGLRDEAPGQPESEVIVIAVPVFGGRIPSVAAKKLRQLDGKGKKAVTLAVYGTRAYEDALLELNDVASAAGFQVIASAALVAQHSIVPEVGAGRPDEADRSFIQNFAGEVLRKLESGAETPVKVPGNYPYKPEMSVSVPPMSLSSCSGCGSCVSVCPTGAIRLENGAVVTNVENCILCMACVAACPERARILPTPLQEQMNQKLGVLKDVHRENEYFL